MTFDAHTPYSEAYVWVWLPNATEPVVAGLLTQQGPQLVFNYGRSYLARTELARWIFRHHRPSMCRGRRSSLPWKSC
jgi:hypothetical protein